ncbi:MAG: DUF2273 domain-containing protein [Centipeda sp. (in: firmicutes)]|uniref:DUF2273 domain-containing protein n=1 Tax=Selenomonas sp. oral taxon 920 TaxID=1884263 RepID=UPI000840B758|nr:DUF2273 domain-containing protein [Selenomonas sp. oral taxon 920]AOH48206.1 hypothetical protein BCS37_07035 [Selenomonas sp. oral taxon 920]
MKENILLLLQDQWEHHRSRTVGLLLGALFGICVLIFGFWHIVFVILCAAIGMYIGLRAERVGGWAELIDTSVLSRLFRRMS